jgi:hypothetical protein
MKNDDENVSQAMAAVRHLYGQLHGCTVVPPSEGTCSLAQMDSHVEEILTHLRALRAPGAVAALSEKIALPKTTATDAGPDFEMDEG